MHQITKTLALDATICKEGKYGDVPIMLHYLGDIQSTVDHLWASPSNSKPSCLITSIAPDAA